MLPVAMPEQSGTRRFDVGTGLLVVTQNRVTSFDPSPDAIVVWDDSFLTHADGAAAQVWEAAGPELEDEVRRVSPLLHLGEVYASSAGRLPARWLLHAATLDLDAADSLLDRLGDPGKSRFPRVVTVDSIRVDRLGRQVVRVVDDASDKLALLTDVDVLPGETYLLHGSPDRLWVDPILVPAGNLGWMPEGRGAGGQ